MLLRSEVLLGVLHLLLRLLFPRCAALAAAAVGCRCQEVHHVGFPLQLGHLQVVIACQNYYKLHRRDTMKGWWEMLPVSTCVHQPFCMFAQQHRMGQTVLL